MNILPANFISSPSDFIAARCTMLAMTFSIKSGRYPVVSIFADANMLTDDNQDKLREIIEEDRENRPALFEKFDASESIANVSSTLFQFADETGPFTEINVLDTNNEDEVKALLLHIDSFLGCDYANMHFSDDSSEGGDNEERRAAIEEEEENEEESEEIVFPLRNNPE